MANSFVHCELNTTDTEKAKGFYGSLFQWDLEDMPMGEHTYTMIKVGGDGVGGGIMKHPMGGPSVWLPYILVDDIEGDTKKAASLGGTVLKEVTEIPDMGWFSVILDPTGAAFGMFKTKM